MKTNKIKYSFSLFFSLIGSEAFKFASSLIIFRFTGDFWLVTFFYLLIQLPSLFTYLINNFFIKKFGEKKVLIFSDISSASLLFIILVLFFIINSNFTFSIILIIINTLLGVIHSFRFVALRSILYFLCNSEKDISVFNLLTSWVTSIALLVAPIFSSFLFIYLEFWTLILFNIITYFISGFLYFVLKINKNALKIDLYIEKNKNDKFFNKNLSWFYVLIIGIIMAIILYPKQAGLIPFLISVNLNLKEWSFIFTIIMASGGILGAILFLLIKNKKISTFWFLIIIAIINLIYIPISFIKDNTLKIVFYFGINFLTQMLYSLFLPKFYNFTYKIFNQNSYNKQSSYSMIFRIIMGSLFSIFLTFLVIYFNYKYAFLLYCLIINLCGFSILIIEKKILKIKKTSSNIILNK